MPPASVTPPYAGRSLPTLASTQVVAAGPKVNNVSPKAAPNSNEQNQEQASPAQSRVYDSAVELYNSTSLYDVANGYTKVVDRSVSWIGDVAVSLRDHGLKGSAQKTGEWLVGGNNFSDVGTALKEKPPKPTKYRGRDILIPDDRTYCQRGSEALGHFGWGVFKLVTLGSVIAEKATSGAPMVCKTLATTVNGLAQIGFGAMKVVCNNPRTSVIAAGIGTGLYLTSHSIMEYSNAEGFKGKFRHGLSVGLCLASTVACSALLFSRD